MKKKLDIENKKSQRWLDKSKNTLTTDDHTI